MNSMRVVLLAKPLPWPNASRIVLLVMVVETMFSIGVNSFGAPPT